MAHIVDNDYQYDQQKGVSIASDMFQRGDRQISKSLISKLRKQAVKLQAKQYLFMMNNTIALIVNLYNLVSVVNIEAYDSFLHYEELSTNPEEFALLYYIVMLTVIHFLRICVNIVGYFGAVLKSQKIMSLYMILTCSMFMIRSILTVLIIISIRQVEQLCVDFFGDEDDVAEVVAFAYCLLLAIFLGVDAIITMISIVQGSGSRENQQSNEYCNSRVIE